MAAAAAYRLARVAFALVAAGALLGALCGLVALAPLALQQWLGPTPDDGFVSARELVAHAAGIGAACGAPLGPALALGLLRAVPLWRVAAALLLGAAGGTLAVWAAAYAGAAPGLPAFPAGAATGAAAAALWLRRRAARRDRAPAA
mgnify:CR=1 FL=1|jgi:hypothetical protein